MKIEVFTSATGSQIYVISILEDLWHDYLFFKEQAVTASQEDNLLLEKRYLRVALLVLLSYFEGVVNNWYSRVLQDRESEKQIEEFVRKKSRARKISFLTREAAGKALSLDEPAFTEARELRNQLVHLKPGIDMEIFEDLTLELLNETEESIVDWLERVGALLGQERHPDTKRIAEVLSAPFDETVRQEDSESLRVSDDGPRSELD